MITKSFTSPFSILLYLIKSLFTVTITMPTIKSLILLFAAVASQIYGTDAASRVVNDGTDQYNRRYANLIYDDMPW